jgi:hypothetical protein
MMKLHTSVSYKLLAHVSVWAVFFLLPLPLAFQRGPGSEFVDSKFILSIEIRNLVLLIFFYINLYYITPAFIAKKNVMSFFLVIVGSVVLVSVISYMVERWLIGMPEIMVHRSFRNGPTGVPPVPPPRLGIGGTMIFRSSPMLLAGPFFSNFLITGIVASVSTLIVMWGKWNQAREDEHERTLQKVAAELSVLKLQISPHFLFNTLNNIRWLVRSKSSQAEEAVVKLSQLLRYILYQTNQEKVPLSKEVQHLEDFIGLQRIRIKNKDRVQYNFYGAFDHHQIVPLLFIPLVENFFKYADFESQVTNQIILEVSARSLRFVCWNKIAAGHAIAEPDASGIGLDNLRKRLSLHYPDKHTLTIDHQQDYFEIIMTLELVETKPEES